MKKKILKVLLGFSFAGAGIFALASCDNSSEPANTSYTVSRPTTTETTPEISENKIENKNSTVNLGGIGLGSDKKCEVSFTFNDSYFEGQSNVYNKDLALFLYGAASVNDGKEGVSKFFTDLGFNNAITYPKTVEEYHNISYTIAKKAAKDATYVVVSVRGINYGQEWSSNFELGLEGDHNGFSKAADVVLEDLYTTLGNINGDVKIALTGYSRGGAVANLLADKLFNLPEKKIADKNVYTYTFEAPKGILVDDNRKIDYDNVFNIVNDADIVTALAPSGYGFARCGIDINIYNADVDNLLSKYDSELVLPKFTIIDEQYFKEETEVKDFIINKLLTDYDYDENIKINTREKFVNNYASTIQFIFNNIVTDMKAATKEKIADDIKTKVDAGWTGILELMSIISDGKSLFNFLNPYFVEDGLTYDTTELQNSCNQIVGLIQGPGSFLLTFAASEEYRNTLVRTVDMHFPIVNYVLLENHNA